MELFTQNIIQEQTYDDIFQQDELAWGGITQEETGQTFISPTIIGGTLDGASFRSGSGGARVEIFPDWDKTVGMIIYDDAGSEVFKAIVGGTDVGDIIFGDSATYYVLWDKSAGTLTVHGAAISNPTLTGIQSGSEISIQGWQHDMTFSATDHDTVAWTSGTITLLDGTTYSIDSGNTGTMSAVTYIYLDIATSTTVLQTTTTASDAVGSGKILVAVAQNVASGKKAIFQVFGGKALGGSGKLITADDIVANTITANEIAANTIKAGQIEAGTITATEISTGLYGEIRAKIPSDENLVGYWSFDEGEDTTAADGSDNTNDGTLNNMDDSDWVAGMVGTSLDFDGVDDYVLVSANSTFEDIFDGGGSFSVWIYPRSDGEGNYGRVMNKNSWDLNVREESGGKVKLYFYHIFSGDNGGWKSGLDVNINEWSHIVVVYDADSVDNDPTIYVNGSSITLSEIETPTETRTSDSGQDLYIGNLAAGTRTFDGLIDEIRLYGISLTAEEAYALYKNPAGNKSLVISGVRIVDDTITAAKIKANTITATQINVGTIVISDLSNAGGLATQDTIGASDCDATIISGGKIITGLLTADNIQTGTLTGRTIRTSTGDDRIELTSSDNLEFYTGGALWMKLNSVGIHFYNAAGSLKWIQWVGASDQLTFQNGAGVYYEMSSGAFYPIGTRDLGTTSLSWNQCFFGQTRARLLYPATNNTYDLGTSSIGWRYLYFGTSGRIYRGSDLCFELGAAQIEVSKNFLPSSDNAYTLGDATHEWSEIWAEDNTVHDLHFKDLFRITEKAGTLDFHNKEDKLIAKLDQQGNLFVKGQIKQL